MLSMEQILGANFGEQSSDVRAVFKKTVNVKPYETEVIEAETTLQIDRNISGVERILIRALLQVQIEYEVYANMLMKGYVTREEYETRKQELVGEANSILAKAVEVGCGNINLDRYFNTNGQGAFGNMVQNE